ncbi:MAG: dual specificity protein phosphatase family protein [Actinomycetota bacterium]|nr:dual specificity protein phosphatase family protein [Actinomycetota bacterium]
MSEWFLTYGFADVHDDLIIGAYPLDARDVGAVARLRITRLLNLVQDSEYRPGQRAEVEIALASAGIAELRLPLIDYGNLPIEQLQDAVDTVVAWLRAGERVYLHCRAGWQRSAAVAAGAVAVLDGIGIQAALDQIQRRKPSADPLAHQRRDLARWWDQRGGSGSVTPPREAGGR